MKKEIFLEGPINHSNLLAMLGSYKRPNDKIANMVESGILTRIKKGLYLFTQAQHTGKVSHFQVANVLFGPSYVSMYSALAFYGFLPEKVTTIESITTKRAKKYLTPLGLFKYYTAQSDFFSLGIDYVQMDDSVAFLIASPTKALCDILWHTSKLKLRKPEDLQTFLAKDLRFDMERLKELDVHLIEACRESSRKKMPLALLKELVVSKIAQ